MHVHFIAPARYLQASHEIIRHPRLKATAKSLLLWGLSLPPGSRDTILTIGSRMPEGRMAVSGARGQLIEEGYLHVRRAQHPTKGTWTTRTLLSSVPLTTPEQIAEAWAGCEADGPVRVHNPAVGEPPVQEVGTSPKGEKKREKTTLPGESDEPSVAAARLLCRLTDRDSRVKVGLAEALALAPLVVQWLTRDRSEEHLREALLSGLPARVHAPVGLIRSRLELKMPPEATAPPRRLHECARCADPVPQPGICRVCAGAVPTVVSASEVAAVERNRRGAARARSLMRGQQHRVLTA